MALRIRNWKSFQHYQYRKPPWIKLYREILEDKQWHELSGDTAKGLIMLWLIASEADGYLPDSATLAFRLRISENRAIALLSDCSHWIEGYASDVLAERYQDAIPEKSRVETEKSKSPQSQNLPPAKTAGDVNEFEVFWEAYPKKLGKKEARAEWAKVGCQGRLGEVLAAVADWRRTEQWKLEQYIPYPQNWLKAGLWLENPHTVIARKPDLLEELKKLEGKYAANVG